MNYANSVFTLVVLASACVTGLFYEEHDGKRVEIVLHSLGSAKIELRETIGFTFTLIENFIWIKAIHFHGQLNKAFRIQKNGTLFGKFIKYKYNTTTHPWQYVTRDVTPRPGDRVYYWLNVTTIIGAIYLSQMRHFGLAENGTLYHSKETSEPLQPNTAAPLDENLFHKLDKVLGGFNMP